MNNESLIDTGEPLPAGDLEVGSVGPAVFQIPQSFLDATEELLRIQEQLEEASEKIKADRIERALPGMRRRWTRRI